MHRRGGLLLAVMAILFAWESAERANGYRLYYGLAPTQYSTMLDVGPFAQASVGGLDVGQTYYVVVTAYNAAGESGPSNEVVCDVRQNPKSPCQPKPKGSYWP